ncbi:hypothetical protein ACFQ1Q_09405 [Winogradskyella litorisediminis]|uniref:Uncharacterized protein n=1 Tax=Winogradskyella litorisediminis TaxID=1156618 RepID=A0ABW3NA30_9FLAO
MIKFFRKIRQNLLLKNKFKKYLVYAIGEIFLVVIGILLALSINNWNSNRIKDKIIRNYYERIISELNQEIISAERQKKQNHKLISYNQRALKILNSKNSDSLDILKDLLGATATNWISEYSFPITDEFLNQNFLSEIKNDSLKANFKYFSQVLKITEGLNGYNNDQYRMTIEPFFAKNINYSEVALKNYKKFLIDGGPKTDLRPFFENLELWNILTFKLESLEIEYQMFDKAIKAFKSLKSEIKTELEKK